MKTNIVSTIAFVGFVGLGLLAATGGRFLAEPAKRRLTNAFLAFALTVSFAAGLTQHNLWPFSSWPVLAMPMPAATFDLPTPRIVGVDANGNEYDIDYRAWQPLSLEELTSWLNLHFFHLDRASEDRVGKFFLDRANRAREQALAPSGLAYPNRWLGPLTAPTHILHPAIWSRAGRVPRNCFVRLRIYQESWDLEARRLDPAKLTRVLAYEYPLR
ncbi:MAG: hypothetical protein DMG70_06985 [Acidobacteria bacterium]|nr:MAG: hypothetical protein DMG70_06985 [Acidobacteriota bacterium]PYY07399.1 MAG: hypothetical protein DMG69_19565 [Acidobacteriota bacterium]